MHKPCVSNDVGLFFQVQICSYLYNGTANISKSEQLSSVVACTLVRVVVRMSFWKWLPIRILSSWIKTALTKVSIRGWRSFSRHVLLVGIFNLRENLIYSLPPSSFCKSKETSISRRGFYLSASIMYSLSVPPSYISL